MGRKAERIVHKFFNGDFKIVPIMHYSHYISLEKYCSSVWTYSQSQCQLIYAVASHSSIWDFESLDLHRVLSGGDALLDGSGLGRHPD